MIRRSRLIYIKKEIEENREGKIKKESERDRKKKKNKER